MVNGVTAILWRSFFFHENKGYDLLSENCLRGRTQEPPRDAPSNGISAKLYVAAGRNETKRAIVALMVMLKIIIVT